MKKFICVAALLMVGCFVDEGASNVADLQRVEEAKPLPDTEEFRRLSARAFAEAWAEEIAPHDVPMAAAIYSLSDQEAFVELELACDMRQELSLSSDPDSTRNTIAQDLQNDAVTESLALMHIDTATAAAEAAYLRLVDEGV